MNKIEKEIRDCYSNMGVKMATPMLFGSSLWDANSQYGYCMMDRFSSKELAEEFVIRYYTENIELIRQ